MKSGPLIHVFLFLLVAFFSDATLDQAAGTPTAPIPLPAVAGKSPANHPPATARDDTSEAAEPPSSSLQQKIPDKALAILKAIQDRDGESPPGYVGGRAFRNRERPRSGPAAIGERHASSSNNGREKPITPGIITRLSFR